MEVKKNPTKDIHQKSFMFFQIGLGISIALVITAFEWQTEVRKPKPRVVDIIETGLVLIPSTHHPEPEPPSPTPEKKEISKPTELIIISTETSETSEAIPENAIINPEDHTSLSINLPIDEPEVCHDCPFLFVEEQPMPIGGYEGYYRIISKNLKYPRRAQNMDVQGRVTVEFIVNRDGQPSDMKIIKGIGGGCDEEAMRVIGLTKWNPGKQRGKPVRVRMVMPIQFHLN